MTPASSIAPPGIVLREAVPSDIPALVALLAVLFAGEREFAPDAERQRAGLGRIVGRPEVGVVLVAERGDSVVGMVSLLFTVSTFLGAQVALLEDLVVTPEARGAGVGRQLIKLALEQARAAGARRVTLLTDHDNLPAQRLYEAHGFARSTMVVYRRGLSDDGGALD